MVKAHKVLMLLENCSAPLDNRVWAEAVALRDYGFQVSIIGPKGSTVDRESSVCVEGIHIYRYSLPTSSNKYAAYILEYSVALFMTFLLSLKVLFRHGFDVIHAANPPDLFFAIGVFYRLFGKRFIYDQHDPSPEMFQVKFAGRIKLLHKLMLFLEWCSYRTAHLVIVPNLSVKQLAIERGGFPSDRVFVVRNVPELSRIKLVMPEPELKRGKRYALAYVGSVEVQNGVEYALYALDDLIHKRGRQDVLLIVIGDGTEASRLHKLVDERQLSQYVSFTGELAAKDIVRYLTVADIGLTPSPANGQNELNTFTKTMEYMAMGKAGVAFDLAETRLTAQDAVLYATPNHTEDFANKIETLLDDEELRSRMGAFGRKRIEETLNWDYEKKLLLSAYEALFSMSFKPSFSDAIRS